MVSIESIGKAIYGKGQEAADKAKDMTQIARLRSQIRTCEDVIRKNAFEIGQMVYAMYEEKAESEESGEAICQEDLGVGVMGKPLTERFARQCENIANAKRAITDLKKQIKAIQEKQ
ncbi:MAG: hypothetical protein J5546_07305 [Lachnospiraceae bacterium]|nr:hypothetical protein [Lachnospiraceae bacterium]